MIVLVLVLLVLAALGVVRFALVGPARVRRLPGKGSHL